MNILPIVGLAASENRSCVVPPPCRCSIDIDPPIHLRFATDFGAVLQDHDECSTRK